MKFLTTLPAKVLSSILRGYQLLLSPVFPPSCRFSPSCSQYSIEAVRRFGALGGGWLALCRMVRCHPWGGQGHDPVPEQISRQTDRTRDGHGSA